MTTGSKGTTALGALAAIAAAVALAACGSSDSGSGDDAASKLPGPAVKLMTIYPKGGIVPLPEIPDGAQAAVDALNEGGGINGKRVELIVCSDGNNANTAADCARKGVKEGVVALVGSSSTFSTVVLPIMSKAHIPSIGNVPATVADFVSLASYPIAGGPTTTFAALPRFVADQGAKRIVMVRPDLAPAVTAVDTANIGLKPLGLKMAGQVAVPVSAPDMATYVAQVQAQKADAVVVILPGPQAISFVEAMRQADSDVKIGLSSTEPGPVHEALGDGAQGIVQALDWLPVPGSDTPAALEYEKQMKDAGFDDISGYRVNSWMAVRVVADLAKKMPELTGAALQAQLDKTSGLRTGLTPPLQWEQGNVGGTPRSFSGCALASVLQADGSQKLVTGKFFDVFNNRACPTP